jgi:hypothetical protein
VVGKMLKGKRFIIMAVIGMIVVFGIINSLKKEEKTSGTTNTEVEETTTNENAVRTKEPFSTLPPVEDDPEMDIISDEEMKEEMVEKNNKSEEMSESQIIKTDVYKFEELIRNYLVSHIYYLKGSKDFFYSMIDRSGDYFKNKEIGLNETINRKAELDYELLKIESVEEGNNELIINAYVNIGIKKAESTEFTYTKQNKWYKVRKIEGKYIFILEGVIDD